MATTGRDFRKLDFEHFSFSPLTKSDRGGLTGKILYDGGELIIQLPICRAPYGLSEQKSDNGRSTYSVNGSFDKTSPILSEWYKWCENFEEILIKYAQENSKACFNKMLSIEAVRALSNGIIKISSDEEKAAKYDPTFKTIVRAKADGSGFWTKCYDTDKTPMSIADIHKGCKGRMIIKLGNFYVINGKFGVTFDLESFFVTQHSSHSVIQEDVNMYDEEPAHPADVYDEHMEEALQKAQIESDLRKRERETSETPVDETPVKKPAKKTVNKK